MSVEKNKAVWMRALEEVWHKGNLSVIDETFAPDYVFHGPPSTRSVLYGPDGYRDVVKLYRTAFPDCYFTVEEMFGEGDKVVQRWTFHGTHKGDFAGIKPTGKRIANPGVTINRFAGGKVADEWSIWDERHFYQELGAQDRG